MTRENQTPTPGRITAALDLRGLYGPYVDMACGGEEPMVDQWEAGTRIPSAAQVELLAALTEFPVDFFYRPESPTLGAIWMCSRKKPDRNTPRCQRIEPKPPVTPPPDVLF